MLLHINQMRGKVTSLKERLRKIEESLKDK